MPKYYKKWGPPSPNLKTYQFYYCAFAIQLMEKLGEVTIDNSLNVMISWQVDQHLLGKNFATIVNALKDLQGAQLKQEGMIKDLLGLREKVDHIGGTVEKIERNGANVTNSKEVVVSNPGTEQLESDLMALTKRVDKNQANTMENIKDINLINKELVDLKKLIDGLRNQITHSSSVQIDRQGKNSYQMHDIAENMSRELQLSSEKMKEMEARLMKAEEQLGKHDRDIKDLLERQDKGKGQSTAPSSKLDKDLQELKRDLRDKLEVINKKISNLQSDFDGHDQDINEIKDMLAERDENKHENSNQQANTQKEQTNISTLDFNALRRKVEEVDKREARDVKNLLEEINSLKQELKNQAQRSEAKSNFEEELKSNKRAQTPKDDSNERLNDLILKVNYLEKLMAGSKNSLNDDKNPEKLPTITRHRKRDANFTVYQEKDKSGISRKDLAELKAELQAWIRSLFDQNKEKENFQELELKIQEIKRSLQRKADAQGTKKGFNFLENKITQLYLFLTEPDTEDAMIVRKGFNCLSCSKRVEKLRGRIGPKLNWNNMTTTNYSPPKVGYSKPMGESSIQKADD